VRERKLKTTNQRGIKMIIQHNSFDKIDKIERFFGEDLLGCLCFGEEGHDYNLANQVNFKYVIDIDDENVLEMSRVWFCHDSEELSRQAEEVIQDLMDVLDTDRARALDFFDGSDTDCETNTNYSGFSAGWYVQQSMGLLAHALGYDAALDKDEQGDVFVVYCVERELQEVE